MGDDFYCILKLISGEEIFSHVIIDENDGDTLIVLQKPVIIKVIQNHGNQYVKIKPWIELSDDELFIIKLNMVITMTETTNKKLIDLYENYLVDDLMTAQYDESGMVKPSQKMGYVSSVEETRKRLEKLFNQSH